MIDLDREPPEMGEQERCCFCRAKTPHWTCLPKRKPGEQVACCERCARKAKPEDVPTKRDWCRREEIAGEGSFYCEQKQRIV